MWHGISPGGHRKLPVIDLIEPFLRIICMCIELLLLNKVFDLTLKVPIHATTVAVKLRSQAPDVEVEHQIGYLPVNLGERRFWLVDISAYFRRQSPTE
jgi:hypothetical protein